MRMAEYYFENRKDRSLKAYLKIGESIESSFLLTFELTDAIPQNVVKGSDKVNEKLLDEFKRIAKMRYAQIAQDHSIDWIPIPVTDNPSKIDDNSLVYDTAITSLVKDYVEALKLNQYGDNRT